MSRGAGTEGLAFSRAQMASLLSVRPFSACAYSVASSWVRVRARARARARVRAKAS
jgi:hypothetical protein